MFGKTSEEIACPDNMPAVTSDAARKKEYFIFMFIPKNRYP
jgi:hypothetical protein